MIKHHFILGKMRGKALLATGAAILLLVLASCTTVYRTAVVLPDYPGATYIGTDQCDLCHNSICRNFPTADHARLMAKGNNALNAGCESCHGPCSVHSDSGGDILPPYSFTSGRDTRDSFGARVTDDPPRSEETVCYQCHGEVRAEFELPTHHPVPEGRMTCTDCHNPHEGSIFKGGGTDLLSQNDMCLKCHPAERGPYVFEHQALREGCTTCHNPHGSINAKLLLDRDSNLCLRCHFEQYTGTQILIGGADHTRRLAEGTCWTAGCHEAVHGSRVNPYLGF